VTTRPVVALPGVRPDEVHVVRVFADADGRHGNELGIVLASERTDGREPAIARALGFSETVFVDAVDAPGADPLGASIRILTPARELPFAGHPTVGTAGGWGRAACPSTTCGCPRASWRCRASRTRCG
jgi:PhzF family phenazine biosynthesis protein